MKRTPFLLLAATLLLACGSTVEIATGGASTHTTTTTNTSSDTTWSTTWPTQTCPPSCQSDADCASCPQGDGVDCCDTGTGTCFHSPEPACAAPLCISPCTADAECAATCPGLPPGLSNCCDKQAGICYVATTPDCSEPPPPPPPPACAPGSPCMPGPAPCTPWGLSGVCTCTCDVTGHYACGVAEPPPLCPSPPPECNAPCADTLTCKCSRGPGLPLEACGCIFGVRYCWGSDPSACAVGGARGASCAGFPIGLDCTSSGYKCICSDACGLPLWACDVVSI